MPASSLVATVLLNHSGFSASSVDLFMGDDGRRGGRAGSTAQDATAPEGRGTSAPAGASSSWKSSAPAAPDGGTARLGKLAAMAGQVTKADSTITGGIGRQSKEQEENEKLKPAVGKSGLRPGGPEAAAAVQGHAWDFLQAKAGTGTTDRYGFAIKMGPLDKRTQEERAEVRSRSAAAQVNIDPMERARRTAVGLGLVSASILVAALLIQARDTATSSSMMDVGGPLGSMAVVDAAARQLTKLAVVPPFAFGALLAVSGISGL
eukprot:gene1588-1928_t